MLTCTLFLLSSVLGAQQVRVPSTGYHTLPDTRVQPTAAQLAPAVHAAPAPRTTAGPRPAQRALAPAERTAARAASLGGELTAPHFDIDADGRHWARGTNFKMSFGADGASFVPFLGSDAPQNFPVDFELARAEQGGVVAPLATPAVGRSGERIVLDQGFVRSEYVVGLHGVEQLFVLDAPFGAGDLVLDLALETGLALTPDGNGWRFESALGGVSYGAAFVVDAAGRKLDLATVHTGEGFRFTVPSSFLADATWPIAVDPLIATFGVDTDPIDQFAADVAFDPTTSQYLVVFEEVFSAADHDIKSWLVTDNGSVVAASNRYIDFTFTNRTEPCVALTNARRAFLCAFTEGPSSGPRRIGARSRNADTSALGTAFIVDENTASDRFSPDICGDAFPGAGDAHYTIVWRRFWAATDSDVVVRVVNEDGTFVTSELYVTNLIGISDEEPSISKCITPGQNDSVVVWRRGGEILASLVSYNGGTVRAEFSLATSFQALSNPQVSGLSTALLAGSFDPTFVAVWDADYATDRDIEGVVCAASNSASTPVVSPTQFITFMEHVDFLLDQREPDVANLGDRWIITQNAVYPGYTDYVTRATTVNIVGGRLGVSERFEALTGTFDETLTPKTASRYEAGDTASLEAMTCWVQQVTFGQPGDIYGAVHAASPLNTCAAQYAPCFGNPNATTVNFNAFLWVEGDFSTTGTKRLHALDMQINAFGYFLASLNTAAINPPASAGVLCLGGSIGRYSNFVLNSGATGTFFLDINPAAISQPTGPVPALTGQVWYFQAWHRDVAGGAPSSNFTNAAGIPFQ